MPTITLDSLPSAISAVRDILYLYVDMVESYDGFGHNLDTGTFDALAYVDAVLDESPGHSFGLDLRLLHEGCGVAVLCILSDAWDDYEALDHEWPLHSRIHRALVEGRLHHLPLIEKAVQAAYSNERAFRDLLPSVYKACVKAYFQRLAG